MIIHPLGALLIMTMTILRFASAFVCRQFRKDSLQRTAGGRLLGSKAAAGNPPGDICFYNEQDALALDEQQLRQTLTAVRRRIGYDTYDVTLILVDDAEMKNINKESRGMNKPTDILSFPFHPSVSPGVLQDVQFDIPDYYMLVSTLYSYAGRWRRPARVG